MSSRCISFLTPVLLLVLILSSCDRTSLELPGDESQPNMENEAPAPETGNQGQKVKLPDTRLSLTTEQMRSISPGNEFSFKLFNRIREKRKSDSIILSPLSVEFVLGMLCNYVDCAEDLCKMLGLDGKDIDVVNNYFQVLIGDLAKDDMAGLKLSNAIMRDQQAPLFKEELISTLNHYYKADYSSFAALPLSELPVGERPEDLWVKEKTDGMIDSAPIPVLEGEAALFNTICFKGEWVNKFVEENTQDAEFYKADKSKVYVKMMSQICDSTLFYKGSGYASISLLMSDGAYLLTIMLPDEGQDINTVLSGLNSESWETLRSGLSYEKTQIILPKFKTTFSQYNLFNYLDESFTTAFQDGISRMSNNAGSTYSVKDMAQKAAFEIDENGAKAAAVTEALLISSDGGSKPTEIKVFFANHPFVYALSEVGSGLILFIGQYTGK